MDHEWSSWQSHIPLYVIIVNNPSHMFRKLRNILKNMELSVNGIFEGSANNRQFQLKSITEFQCLHKQPHQSHLPFLLKDEKCHTCRSKQCYICSENEHIPNSCKVELSPLINPPPPYYKQSHHLETLKLLNKGYVAKLTIKGLMCHCGKPWEGGSTICAACGVASCSKECHTVWEQKGHCTLHHLFRKEYNQKHDMRSIHYDDIRLIQEKQLPAGTKVNKNTSKFITCFTTSDPQVVYIQRGYRVYGHPHQNQIQQLSVSPANLDFYLHLDRVCQCECISCKAMYHSVGMCTSECTVPRMEKLKQALNEKKHEQICECECSHCISGLIIEGHDHYLTDCMFECLDSEDNTTQDPNNPKDPNDPANPSGPTTGPNGSANSSS